MKCLNCDSSTNGRSLFCQYHASQLGTVPMNIAVWDRLYIKKLADTYRDQGRVEVRYGG